jgi:hypothetical protein
LNHQEKQCMAMQSYGRTSATLISDFRVPNPKNKQVCHTTISTITHQHPSFVRKSTSPLSSLLKPPCMTKPPLTRPHAKYGRPHHASEKKKQNKGFNPGISRELDRPSLSGSPKKSRPRKNAARR